MFGLLIFGFIMMLMAAGAWYYELRSYLDNMYRMAYSNNPVIKIGQQLWVLIVNIYRFFTEGKYFLIDMGVTLFCVDTMGFGEGVTGGVLGLAFSNVVSGLIILTMWRTKKRLELEAANVTLDIQSKTYNQLTQSKEVMVCPK